MPLTPQVIYLYGRGAVGAHPEDAQRPEPLCCGDRLRERCSQGPGGVGPERAGGSDLLVLAGKLLEKSFLSIKNVPPGGRDCCRWL